MDHCLGFFLLVLIGIELLETVKAYLVEYVVHVEIVLEVALVAIARKVIILEPKELPPLTLLSIAALIATLGVAIYLEKRARHLLLPVSTTDQALTPLSRLQQRAREAPVASSLSP